MTELLFWTKDMWYAYYYIEQQFKYNVAQRKDTLFPFDLDLHGQLLHISTDGICTCSKENIYIWHNPTK